ncbi:MAG: LamG-like jellyroll fold domain-containing protein [Candidatus Nanohaloarchaea archaeon]
MRTRHKSFFLLALILFVSAAAFSLSSTSNSAAPQGSLWIEGSSLHWADGSTEYWLSKSLSNSVVSDRFSDGDYSQDPSWSHNGVGSASINSVTQPDGTTGNVVDIDANSVSEEAIITLEKRVFVKNFVYSGSFKKPSGENYADGGIVYRRQDTGNYYYIRSGGGGGSWAISYFSGGTKTNIDSGSFSGCSGVNGEWCDWKIVVSGDTHSFYTKEPGSSSWTLETSFTDSNIMSSGGIGVGANVNSKGSVSRRMFFDVQKLVAGSVRANFHLDSGSGQTVVDDSGWNNDGTRGGSTSSETSDPSWTTGKFDDALSFDGNDYVDIPDSAAVTGSKARTVTAWYKVDEANSDSRGSIITLGKTGTDGEDFAMTLREGAGSGCWRAQLWGSADIDYCISGSYTGWHHQTYTYNGSTFRIYYDGSLIKSKSRSLNTKIGSTNLGRWGGGPDYFAGKIDEVRVYSRALSQQEVQQLYQGAGSKTGGPTGAWWIEGSAMHWIDQNGYERALVGEPELGSQENPALSCNQIYQNIPSAKDGTYFVDPNNDESEIQKVYCDMGVSGSGWTLIYNYDHEANTDPAPTEDQWPLSHGALSHQDDLSRFGYSQNNIKALRFRCETSNHNRVVHYINKDPDAIQGVLDDSTTVSYVSVANDSSKLPEHSGNLPDAAGADTGETEPSPALFGPRFPMYNSANYHWSIGEPGGSGSRWECDDYPDSDNYDTLHQIWIKGIASSVSNGASPGNVWIENSMLHYIDANGNERKTSSDTVLNIFTTSDSYSVDNTPESVSIDESKGEMYDIVMDNSIPDHAGVNFSYSSGTQRTFEFEYSMDSVSGSGSTQSDRHWNLIKLQDSSGCEIMNVGFQYGTQRFAVYDAGVCNPGWRDYQSAYHDSGIDASSGTHTIKLSWTGSAWKVNIDNGAYTYTSSNYNNPAYEVIVGRHQVGSNQNNLVYQFDMKSLNQ